MAERRMFAKTIIDSDAFIDMPTSARLLYYDLGMRADDDGFVNSPRKIMRMTGASEDDMRVLIAKKFILPFDSGVVVIKHWLIHNYIRKDRYDETKYLEEKATLFLDENKAYTQNADKAVCLPNSKQKNDGCQVVDQWLTQDRLGKGRLGKESIGESNIPDTDNPPAPSKPKKHKYGEYNNVLLTDDELQKLKTEYSDYEDRIERLSSYIASTGKKYKSHYATIRNWARKDADRSDNNGINRKRADEASREKWGNIGTYL